MNAEAIKCEYRNAVFYEQISTPTLISILNTFGKPKIILNNNTNTEFTPIRASLYINTQFMLLFVCKCFYLLQMMTLSGHNLGGN